MKKTERLIAAITTIALGILLIVLTGTTVQIITSIFGVLLLVLGVLDLIAKETRVGIVKGLIGIFILAFGWLISSIVLYVVSVVLLIAAVWWIYGDFVRPADIACAHRYVSFVSSRRRKGMGLYRRGHFYGGGRGAGFRVRR